MNRNMMNRNTMGQMEDEILVNISRKDLVQLLKAITEEEQRDLAVKEISQFFDYPIGKDRMKIFVLSVKEGCTTESIESFLNMVYGRLDAYGLAFLFNDEMEEMLKKETALNRGKEIAGRLQDDIMNGGRYYMGYNDKSLIKCMNKCAIQIQRCKLRPTLQNILIMNQMLNTLYFKNMDFPPNKIIQNEILDIAKQVLDLTTTM